jgi:hypothetical protein
MAESLTVANGALIHLGSKVITALADTSKEGRFCNERIGKLRKALLRMHPWNFATKRKHSTVTYSNVNTATELSGEWLLYKATHGLVTGDRVLVVASEDVPSINGQWYVTRIDADNFSLDDSVFDATESAAYVADEATFVKIPQYGWDFMHAVPSDLLRFLRIDGDVDHKIENEFILCNEDTIDIEYIYDVDDDTIMDPLFVEAFALGLAWNLSNVLTQSETMRAQLHDEFKRMLAKARHTDASEDPAGSMDAMDFIDARFEGASPFVRDPMT